MRQVNLQKPLIAKFGLKHSLCHSKLGMRIVNQDYYINPWDATVLKCSYYHTGMLKITDKKHNF